MNDYLDNRAMIEKLYEERQLALAKTVDLENRCSALFEQVRTLELDQQRLDIVLSERTTRSFWVFGISLVATLTLGIGVNVVTSSAIVWLGWLLIVAAVILELIAFFLTKASGR